ncbi:unnamed protein product [Discula destructiva]
MSVSSKSRDASPVSNRPRASKCIRGKEPQTPQEKIDEFWGNYKTKAPGRATSITPQNEFAERAACRAAAKSKAPAKTTEQSYEAAAEQCRRKVAQIVNECRRVNQRYRDPHFDLELDQKLNRRDCLTSLDNQRDDDDDDHHHHYGGGGRYARSSRRRELPKKDREEGAGQPPGRAGSVLGLLSMVEKENTPHSDGDGGTRFHPKAVKRVVDIFDKPQFYIDGPTANDVRQGRDGDCWLMAALCTLSNKPGLIERCCVAHDQAVGVYGFVFHRDGEWFSEIIDDKLYLNKPDYDESFFERILWEDRERVNSEEAYRKAYQSNSGALYFAQCVNPNETWLPLLEKAYAKAHGDYSAIEGGYGGEGIEDLTGGVTSEIYTTDILDKEHFWNEELMKVNQDFLFGCSTGVWGRGWGERRGIVELHAYSVLKAREIDGVRLVLLKNPWGKHEWTGPWSDGSKEWTAEWLQKLDHKFGDDGSFWISYEDLLKKYQAFDRTRLFSPDWKVASIWTTLDVPWTLDYHDTKFAFSLLQSGPVVIVFSQLDERYFKGLEGQYRFELSFRVHHAAGGQGQTDSYVVRSQTYYRMNRSVNVELELEAGEYVVVVKIDAQRFESVMPVEEVVRAHAKERREKLLRIGQAYDLAHAKGKIVETAEEKAAREAFDARRRERERRRIAKCIKETKLAQKKAVLKAKMRERKRRNKEEVKVRARAERKAARRAAKAKAEGDKNAESDGSTKSLDAANDATTAGADADKTASSTDSKPAEEHRLDGSEAKEEEGYVTAAEDVADKEPSSTDEAAAHLITEVKRVKIEVPSTSDNDDQAEGSGPSSEPGDGAHTPTSSTMSSMKPFEGEAEELQEDEAYVTAAEDDIEDHAVPGPEDPSTPKPAVKPANAPPRANSVDASAQTGPGLPMPPPPPPPPRPHYRRGPPPSPPTHHQQHGVYARPPAPHGRPPLPPLNEMNRMPPNMRAAYAAEYAMRYGVCPRPPPPDVSETEIFTSDSSDSELDGEISDDVSDISEHDIDNLLASKRALALRAAAAAAKKSGPAPVGAGDESLDEFEKDPWNAVGVFGLRVYYKVPTAPERQQQEVVKLRVVRPNPYVWDESSDDDDDGEQADDEKEEERKQESQVLDVDDSAKDAVGETPPTPGVELLKQLKGETSGGHGKGAKVEDGETKVGETQPSEVGLSKVESTGGKAETNSAEAGLRKE